MRIALMLVLVAGCKPEATQGTIHPGSVLAPAGHICRLDEAGKMGEPWLVLMATPFVIQRGDRLTCWLPDGGGMVVESRQL